MKVIDSIGPGTTDNFSPTAAATFAGLDGATRFSILYRIGAAKRPETRVRKIAEYVADLEQGLASRRRR